MSVLVLGRSHRGSLSKLSLSFLLNESLLQPLLARPLSIEPGGSMVADRKSREKESDVPRAFPVAKDGRSQDALDLLNGEACVSIQARELPWPGVLPHGRAPSMTQRACARV